MIKYYQILFPFSLCVSASKNERESKCVCCVVDSKHSLKENAIIMASLTVAHHQNGNYTEHVSDGKHFVLFFCSLLQFSQFLLLQFPLSRRFNFVSLGWKCSVQFENEIRRIYRQKKRCGWFYMMQWNLIGSHWANIILQRIQYRSLSFIYFFGYVCFKGTGNRTRRLVCVWCR